MNIFGATGTIEIEIPFNAPPDRPCRMFVDVGGNPSGEGIEHVEFEVCNQYGIQGTGFRAIRDNTAGAISLEDAVNNMKVIEAVFRSSESGKWGRSR